MPQAPDNWTEPQTSIITRSAQETHGGLANTASQVGGAVGLAMLATASSARAATTTHESSPAAALAAGYDLVFLVAAGLGLAIAVISVLLTRHRRG